MPAAKQLVKIFLYEKNRLRRPHFFAVYSCPISFGEQVILFDEPVPMESVVIRIDSVYNGSVYQDTVLSELAFLTVKE